MFEKLALLDLDGVLCNDGHRVHYALSKSWVSYFAGIPGDTVWPQGQELYENLVLLGYDIAYLTGRREDTRANTVNWFKNSRVFDPDLPLIMRRFSDRRPLCDFKAAVLWQLEELYDEVVLYDDDPSVIEAVRSKMGAQSAVHCGWYTKPPKMIRQGKS